MEQALNRYRNGLAFLRAKATARPSASAFWRSRSGASALEFALVAPIFFALVFSSFEAGWLMTKSMLLDRALTSTVRLMRIGGADAPTTQEQVKRSICDQTTIIENCMDAITVEMRKITTAADFPDSDATCVNRGSKVAPVVNFTPGERSYIMFVRACVISNALTPGIGLALGLSLDAQGGYRLVSNSAFMNEPGT